MFYFIFFLFYSFKYIYISLNFYFIDEAEYAYKERYIPMSLMLTVFSICRKKEIILFLERAIM